MKKKKYGWLRRCFSLMCVLVLISMIVLQSVPVTYASSEPDAFTLEPEDNSQTISTAEIPTDGDTQPGNQLVDDIFSEGNSDTSPEIPADDNSEMFPGLRKGKFQMFFRIHHLNQNRKPVQKSRMINRMNLHQEKTLQKKIQTVSSQIRNPISILNRKMRTSGKTVLQLQH